MCVCITAENVPTSTGHDVHVWGCLVEELQLPLFGCLRVSSSPLMLYAICDVKVISSPEVSMGRETTVVKLNGWAWILFSKQVLASTPQQDPHVLLSVMPSCHSGHDLSCLLLGEME